MADTQLAPYLKRFCLAGFFLIVTAMAIAGLSSPVMAQDFEVRDNDIALGPADAPVTVVEYASMSCPHCAVFHAIGYPILKEYIDAGQLRYVFREFPLNQPAVEVARIIRCAAPEQRFTFIDLYFKRQNDWLIRDRDQRLSTLKSIASLGGMSGEAIDQCMNDQKITELIYTNYQEGHSEYDVRATPTIFINGEKFSGGITADALREEIEDELGG